MNQEITVPGAHSTNHKTTEKDARRIAIKAADAFLKKNSGHIETNKLLASAVFFERDVYESAKKQKLTCEPLQDESDYKKDPLRLHKYPGPWKGKPFYKIIGGEKDEPKSKSRGSETGEVHDSKSLSRGFRRKYQLPKSVTKSRTAPHSIRR